MEDRAQKAVFVMIGILSANKFSASAFSKKSVELALQYVDEIDALVQQSTRRKKRAEEVEPIDWSYVGKLKEWEERGRTYRNYI